MCVLFIVPLTTPEMTSAVRMPEPLQQSADDVTASLRRSRDQDGGCLAKTATTSGPLSLRLSTPMTSTRLPVTSRLLLVDRRR